MRLAGNLEGLVRVVDMEHRAFVVVTLSEDVLAWYQKIVGENELRLESPAVSAQTLQILAVMSGMHSGACGGICTATCHLAWGSKTM